MMVYLNTIVKSCVTSVATKLQDHGTMLQCQPYIRVYNQTNLIYRLVSWSFVYISLLFTYLYVFSNDIQLFVGISMVL